jgi:HAD superfamily hydrolase (TIGR01509 family)
MLKAITFDLDMTLLDFYKFKRAGSDAAAKAMVKAGLKMSVQECKKELYDHYLTDIEGDAVLGNFLKARNAYNEKILAAGINAYLKSKYLHLKPYPQVRATINKLKQMGIEVAIVTDAPRLKAYMRLDAVGLADLFDIVVGFEDTLNRKPSILPFEKVLQLLDSSPAQAMHVGDWPERDVRGAKLIGMQTCLANYGYKSHKNGVFVQPDYTIENFSELVPLAQRLKKKE